CRSLDRDELASSGQARGLMIVPVNRVEDIAADEQLVERGCFPSIAHPALEGVIRTVRSPFRSSAYEVPAYPAPLLGEHAVEVLRELGGLPVTAIERLRSLGIVRGETNATPSRLARRPPAKEGPGGVAAHASAEPRLPLAGYRVVDFCWQAAGPLMTELLANL